MSISNVVFLPTGSASHTKYFGKNSDLTIKITKKHHPLFGQSVPLSHDQAKHLIIVLPDLSRVRIPREWTDIDSELESPLGGTEEHFSIKSVKALIEKTKSILEQVIQNH